MDRRDRQTEFQKVRLSSGAFALGDGVGELRYHTEASSGGKRHALATVRFAKDMPLSKVRIEAGPRVPSPPELAAHFRSTPSIWMGADKCIRVRIYTYFNLALDPAPFRLARTRRTMNQSSPSKCRRLEQMDGQFQSLKQVLDLKPEATLGCGFDRLHGSRGLILCVEDHAGLREIIQAALTSHGYRVLAAADGSEALQLYQEHAQAIQVILTDLKMAGMDGIALIRALRELAPGARIVVSTAVDLKERGPLEELSALGVTEILAKPYPIERLLATLQELVNERRESKP